MDGWWLVVDWWIKGSGCMVEWLSVTQLSKVLEIPETTVRRHLNNFEEFFRSEQIGRGKKYHPGSVEVLQRIAMLYDTDRETIEIRKILANEYAFEVEETNDYDTTVQSPAYNLSGKLDEFQQRQEVFNKELLGQLLEQQKYIKELAESRDSAFQEIKRLASPEKSRLERLDQIMTEHKVKRLLEKEAIDLWNEKPEQERLIKVGWFRRKEDENKRNQFVTKYIDDYFSTYLKKEFGV